MTKIKTMSKGEERFYFNGGMTEISTELDMGKIDFNDTGERTNAVTIDISLKKKKKGLALSISAAVWNYRHSDCLQCGQCLDSLLPYFKTNKLFLSVYRLWNLYHLNDMKAGCEHQRAAKWEDKRIDPKELPNSHANRDKRGIVAHWIYPLEAKGRNFVDSDSIHKDGLLTKPCPVCKYRYGSVWLFEPIPDADLRSIIRIIQKRRA